MQGRQRRHRNGHNQDIQDDIRDRVRDQDLIMAHALAGVLAVPHIPVVADGRAREE